jgi:hypothetical protein
MIQYPADSKPHIKWNHIDGPLLFCRDGTPHWLTIRERLWLRMGLTNINQLDEKYCQEPQRG